MMGRARQNGLLNVRLWDIREFAGDRHRTVDDTPYGGGPGMVMKIEPLAACLDQVLAEAPPAGRVLVTSPQGAVLDHRYVQELAGAARLVIVCGHYEGIDERLHELYPTEEFSIGDYVLTGGELPAMVLIDAVCRFVPGVLGERGSAAADCFSGGLLKYPQYSRPELFRGKSVPAVLLSGHHEQISRWRRMQSLWRTARRRPDLLDSLALSPEDRRLLAEAAAGAGCGDKLSGR